MALPDIREKMRVLMSETIADEAAHRDWVYDAVRPMPVPSSWQPGQRVVGDCSKGSQYLARWAGAPDPMDRNFDPYGNSVTMTVHLPRLDTADELDVGDYVTFGTYGQDHATVVLEKGSDPLLWSFGRPGAPGPYRLSADPRPRHFLLNPVPHAPETPDEKLRARKGFWSWLQWKLGEGHWKGRGKANPKVRPDVPKRIPLAWWKRYARLVLLRRKRRTNGELASTPAGGSGTGSEQTI